LVCATSHRRRRGHEGGRIEKRVRCAIYTRVSTDQGLEQDFNSLDAQYDASQAYIRSQQHAGWTMVRSKYDDGGFSGGNTDRPALQRLLEDVRAGKIDIVVIYKVDRRVAANHWRSVGWAPHGRLQLQPLSGLGRGASRAQPRPCGNPSALAEGWTDWPAARDGDAR
jgi:Resolvase, N terminal domain